MKSKSQYVFRTVYPEDCDPNKFPSNIEKENSSLTIDNSLETWRTMKYAIEILTKELLNSKAYLRTQDQVNELEAAIEYLQNFSKII